MFNLENNLGVSCIISLFSIIYWTSLMHNLSKNRIQDCTVHGECTTYITKQCASGTQEHMSSLLAVQSIFAVRRQLISTDTPKHTRGMPTRRRENPWPKTKRQSFLQQCRASSRRLHLPRCRRPATARKALSFSPNQPTKPPPTRRRKGSKGKERFRYLQSRERERRDTCTADLAPSRPQSTR